MVARSFEQVLVEGLLATAPEETQSMTYQLVSDLKAMISKYPKEVTVLALLKVHQDVAQQIRKDLEKRVKG